MIDLRLGPCSYATAKDAVIRWHYSGRLQAVTSDQFSVREDGELVGVVVFTNGSMNVAKPFGLERGVVCELARVALGNHRTPTSRIVAIAVRLLRAKRPGMRLVVSFADSREGHHGGIYQAGGWTYIGSSSLHVYRVNGNEIHPKTLHTRYGKGGQSVPWLRANVDPVAERVQTPPKHKYVMPLDAGIRALVAPMAKPYPKRATSIDGDAPASQAGQGGSIPTVALCNTPAHAVG